MPDEIIPKEEVAVEAPIEPVFEPVQASEPQTAQIPVNEPLAEPTETPSKIETEPIPETKTIPEPTKIENVPEESPSSASLPKEIPPASIIISTKTLARELLVKARNMIQFRKRRKLDKIMTLFAKQTKITNDEVEKFLHVSDATANRYLSQLEKENKIKQNGKTGKSVFYSKI